MTVTNLSTFAQLVTQFRQRQGMSQGQLAQATRLSRTYIYHLEAGMRSNPPPHVAQSIARTLELQGEDKRLFYTAYTSLKVPSFDDEDLETHILHFAYLSSL